MKLSETKIGKAMALVIGLSFFLGEGLNYSQLGPFFPTEAHNKKNVSVTMVGIITGAFDVANLVTSFLVTSIATKKTQKFFFCAGAFISATCSALFGVMGWSVGGAPFISVCILTRILMGVGASMVWSTGLPILVPIYPKWAGKITGLVESFVGLGSMVGPTIGSALYSLGGYTLPFLASGTVEIVIGVFAMIFLPSGYKSNKKDPDDPDEISSGKEIKENPGFNFLYYITRFELLLTSGSLVLMSSAQGFMDVAIGPYLDQKFGVGGDVSGYYFLGYSAAYLAISPLHGYLVDRGHAGRVYVICSWISAIGYFMMWLPDILDVFESRVWLLVWMAVQGFACCGGFIPSYLLFEKVAYKVGFRNESNIKLMTASWLNACFATGKMLGPIVIGGVFMDYYGYYNACLFQSALTSLVALSATFICISLGFTKRLYYSQKGANLSLVVSYKSLEEHLSYVDDTRSASEKEPSGILFVSGRYNPGTSIALQRSRSIKT